MRLLCVTGIRSDYDILYPVLSELKKANHELIIVVSGAHLSDQHNNTYKRIIEDGFQIADKVDTLLSTDRAVQRSKGTGLLIQGLTQTVERTDPDFLLVLGDREESIATAIVGNYMEKLVVHIGGGDPVYGNADDPMRFAVSKLAHIHCCTAQAYAENLLKIGEENFRIFFTGNPAYANIDFVPMIEKVELMNQLEIESENYIDRLTYLKYVGDSVVHRYRLGRKNFFLKQIRSKLGISNNTGIMRLSRPDKDKFIVETRNYIYKLFNNYATKYNLRTIVLDQAIPISNHMKSMNYFDSIKLIKVDRDPRDIYVNLIKRKKLIGFELAKDQSVDKYISWHRTLREKSAIDNTNQNILTVNFEDLSLDYKSAVSKLSDFIGDDAIHKNAGKKFDPKLAIKNIGLWKSYKDQRSIDKIYEAFPDDCFDI